MPCLPVSRPFVIVLLAALACLVVHSRPAAAQECRHTCRIDETRDANGCCIPGNASVSAAAVTSATAATLPRHCPSGTTWSDRDRGCVGHLVCPEGSRPLPGGGCESQLVACPAGTRHEGDRCVADVTCPSNTRLVDNACVADVTCPPNTTLEHGQCVSHEVTCPADTRREPDGRCVGRPICPSGTSFSEGNGCTGAFVCPPGLHRNGNTCTGDVACPEGSSFVPGPGCVALCSTYEHAHWEGERHACACDEGFSAVAGRCEPRIVCPAGTHRAGNACAGAVTCPEGFTVVPGVSGCVDREVQAQIEHRSALAREIAAHDRAARWLEGPAGQAWVSAGYSYVNLPNAYQRPPGSASSDGVGALWQGFSPSAGLEFSTQGLIIGAQYTYVPATTVSFDSASTLAYNPLHLLMLELGVQGVWSRFALRFIAAAGYDLGGSGVPGTAGFRGVFRIIAGLFAGVDAHGTLFWRPGSSFTGGGQIDGAPAEATDGALGWGFGASAFVGYSLF